MRDADLEVARLTAHVGVLEQQLAALRRRQDEGGAAERAARLGRLYATQRGLRARLRTHLEAGNVDAALGVLADCADVDAKWDATR